MADKSKKIAFVMKLLSLICALCLIGFIIYLRSAGEELPAPSEEAPAEEQITAPPETPAPEEIYTVTISELMPANKSFSVDDEGSFCDWIELYNFGSSAVDLAGCSISDDAASAGWVFPSTVIESGERIVIYCSGTAASAPLHADFSLSSLGETVCLRSPSGEVLVCAEYPECDDDQSVIFEDGSISLTYLATPGYANDDYEGYISDNDGHGDLVIFEVAPFNKTYVWQDGEYYDWIELKNVSDAPVNLSDYYLNDKLDSIKEYTLPDKTINPGQSYVVFCSGDTSLSTLEREHTSFSISSTGESIYLYKTDGTLSDHVYVHDVPLEGSCGRIDGESGFFIFKKFSPCELSSDGYRELSASPTCLTQQGVYENVTGVSVELSGIGRIFYTLDGSVPTSASTEYTAPFTLDKTAVVRAVSVESGKMDSPCSSFSFIINEGHDLPVVSLTMDPVKFDTVYHRFDLDLEEAGHVSFFDGESSFDLDCGVKLHGATSKKAQDKKSLKLCFRSRYDGELNYDLFENDVTVFSSILLRAAQEDFYSTQMRDNLMHQLAMQCDPDLSTQDYKYAVLYINGKYWGLYNIREAHSTEHFANHTGYDPEQVTQWKEKWPYFTDMAETYDYMTYHDLSIAENYEYVCSHLDIDSFISWSIIEAYSGNIDVEPPNVRYYYTAEDNKTHMALVDLDLGMFGQETFTVPFETMYNYSTIYVKLLASSEFRTQYLTKLSEYLQGPLSVENALSILDSFESEMESEIPRDKERWGGSLETWKSMVNDLRNFLTSNGGRAYVMSRAINQYIGLSSNALSTYFGNITPYTA